MLRTAAFGRWPLTLRFFDEKAWKAWQLTCNEEPPLPEGLKVVVDTTHVPEAAEVDDDGVPMSAQRKQKKAMFAARGAGRLEGLDIGLGRYEPWMEKSRSVLAEGAACAGCEGRDREGLVVCPHVLCEHTAHFQCLAKSWLGVGEVLPVRGSCPGCGKEREWGETVRELSARTRMTKTESMKVRMREENARKKAAEKAKGQAVEEEEEEDEEEDDDMDLDEEANISLVDMTDIPEGNEDEIAELLDAEDGDEDILEPPKSPARKSKAKKSPAAKRPSLLDILNEETESDAPSPPKQKARKTPSEDDEALTKAPVKRDRSKKVPLEDSVLELSDPEPKKRGRPRKMLPAGEPSSPSTDTPEPTLPKTGRAKKAVAVEAAVDVGNDTLELVSPKRGRPKKIVPVEMDLAGSGSDSDSSSPPFAAPPKKPSARKAASTPESAPAKKSPSDPRTKASSLGKSKAKKSTIDSERDEEAVEVAKPMPVKRGRGRPRTIIYLDSSSP